MAEEQDPPYAFEGLYSGIGLGHTEPKVLESDRDRALVELQRMQMRIVEPEDERE